MANITGSEVRVDQTAGAVGSGAELVTVLSPVAIAADITPRIFGSAKALFETHGYSEGLEFAAVHIDRTGLPVMFVGLPISAPGVIGREDTSGNTGTASTAIAAGADGVLAEHDGVLSVLTGGTVGTSQIVLGLSLDGGRTVVPVRVGTGTAYTIPFVGAGITLGAGVLVAGDTVHTWHGTAPSYSNADQTAARLALAERLQLQRMIVRVPPVESLADAQAFLAELNAYETASDRYVQGLARVADRAPLARLSSVAVRMTPGASLTFTTDTLTRAAGSWLADGFVVGDTITISGTTSNNGSLVVSAVSALAMTATGAVAEGPIATAAITGTATIDFDTSANTATRNRGSWLADGFRVGDTITVDGTAYNDGAHTVASVSALVLEVADFPADEVIAATAMTATAGQTMSEFVAARDATFAPLDGEFRIQLDLGMGRILSPFSGWYMRRPAGWFDAWRAFRNDLHIPTWRPADGPVGADLWDTSGALVEYDDRVYQSAAAGRFTSLRTWGNGPGGAFVSRSLTRAGDASVLSNAHIAAVTNEGCAAVDRGTVQAVIGQSLILKPDGTATAESLALVQGQVGREVERALLSDLKNQGPRASSAKWAPSTDDDLSVAEPVMTGVLTITHRGAVHTVRTAVRLNQGA